MPRPMLVPAQDSVIVLCFYKPISTSSPEYKPRVGRPLKRGLSVYKSRSGATKSPDLPSEGSQVVSSTDTHVIMGQCLQG